MKNRKTNKLKVAVTGPITREIVGNTKIKNLLEVEKVVGKTQGVGASGEKVAEVYFKNKGHTIVEKNYRKLRGEIDLITIDDGVLHFVEVKTSSEHLPNPPLLYSDLILNDKGRENYKNVNQKSSSTFFSALNREYLHRSKIKKVIRMSEVYRAEKNIPENIDSQIDGLLVSLIYDGDRIHSVKVQHIPHIDRFIQW